MSRFANGLAVVTGGGSGIGAALAREAARRGARVAVADIDEAAAQAVADMIKAAGGNAKAYRTDVTDGDALRVLAGAIESDMGSPNIVFANAGVAAGGTLAQTKPADFAWLFSVNVTGTLNTIQPFLPGLLGHAGQGRPAHVMATGSEHSLGLPKIGPSSAYTATKHAILGMMEALRRDLDGTGVIASVICPGLVATNLADASRARQVQFGGPVHLSAERREAIGAMMRAHAQDPAWTAQLACDGIEESAFIVIADPEIRALAERRHDEVLQALARLDRRLSEAVPSLAAET